MVSASGATTINHSANGGIRSAYCPPGFSFQSGGTGGNVCARARPVISPKNLGCCTGDDLGRMQGNPINTGIGNKVQHETDLVGAGLLPLDFKRTYNSLYSPYVSSFGGRWSGTYDRAVVRTIGSAQVIVARPDGKAFFFTMNGDVGVGDPDVPDRLLRKVDASGNAVGWEYIAADDKVEQYDVNGKLLSITDRNGFSHLLIYSDASTHHSVAAYPGLLIAVQDSWGRRLQFTYDGRNRLSTVVDPGGSKIEYGYDAGGNLTSRKTQDGLARTYVYNEPEHRSSQSLPYALTGIVAEDGQRYATFKYDAQGRAISTEHAGGVEKVSVAYGTNNTATVTDALGAIRTFAFTKKHDVFKLTSIQEPCPACPGGSGSRTITLDANGFIDFSTDLAGVATDFDHNVRGLEVRRVESANHAATKRTTETAWHSIFRTPTERLIKDSTGAAVQKAQWSHNDRGQVVVSSQIDPISGASRSSTTTYCEPADVVAGQCPLVGLPLSQDGPRTEVVDKTTYSYYMSDAAGCSTSGASCAYRKGDLWKRVDALGRAIEVLSYDAAGRVLSSKDANGVVTDFEYHPRGWIAATKVRGTNNSMETDDRITRIEYWPTGAVKRMVLPDGSSTSYAYDAAKRLTDVVDDVGNSIHYTLDDAGNRKQEDTKTANGAIKRTLSRVYNALGQLQVVKDASQNATSFSYDAGGNLDQTTDALGRITDQNLDPLNRLSRTLQDVNGLAVETKYEYNAFDQTTKVVDPKGLSTTYSYNGFGDQVQLSSPDTGVTTFVYTAAGQVASKQDANDAQAHTYTYDALGRTKTVSYGSGSADVEYDYDTVNSACTAGETFAIGRVTAMRTEGTELKYCYDRFGQVVRKVQSIDGQSFTLRYAYTLAGQLQALTYPDGAVADYVRDSQGRVSAIGVTPAGGVRNVLLNNTTYEPFGPVAGWTYGNGRSLARTYDQDYRAKTILDSASGGLSLAYGYNEVGELTELKDGLQSAFLAKYDYDTLGRLKITRDGPTGTPLETYGYDATGNRNSLLHGGITTNYTYPGTSHRLSNVGGVSRGYDLVGNTTSIGGTAREFVYNANDRMSQVKQAGVVKASYRYNAKGERVSRADNATGAITGYTLYDEAGHWLGDYDANGATKQQAIWLGDAPVGLVVGAGVAQTLRYVQPDHLGTPRAVIDPSRNLAIWTWDAKGEAFGNNPPNQDPDQDGTAFVFDMRFPGQRFDAAMGLNYNYFRDYDAATGRYGQSDPLGLLGGFNTYGYGYQNPNSYVDPDGRLAFLLPLVPPAVVAVGGAVAFFGSAALVAWAGSEAINYYSKPAPNSSTSSGAQDAARQSEYEVAKRFCDTPPPPGGNECSTLSSAIDHAERCVSLYDAWDNKWLPGRHSEKIATWRNRIENLKQEHHRKCTNKCL